MSIDTKDNHVFDDCIKQRTNVSKTACRLATDISAPVCTLTEQAFAFITLKLKRDRSRTHLSLHSGLLIYLGNRRESMSGRLHIYRKQENKVTNSF